MDQLSEDTEPQTDADVGRDDSQEQGVALDASSENQRHDLHEDQDTHADGHCGGHAPPAPVVREEEGRYEGAQPEECLERTEDVGEEQGDSRGDEEGGEGEQHRANGDVRPRELPRLLHAAKVRTSGGTGKSQRLWPLRLRRCPNPVLDLHRPDARR